MSKPCNSFVRLPPEQRKSRRYWGPTWFNLYFRATDDENATIKNFVCALRDAYGEVEAKALFREACLALEGDGEKILQYLQSRFGHRHPATVEARKRQAIAILGEPGAWINCRNPRPDFETNGLSDGS